MLKDDILLTTSSSRSRIKLMLRVARAYYLDNRTQDEIAREIGYSRPTVSRLLKEAKTRGIVRISIGHVLERIQALEAGLRQLYGLAHARVAEILPSEDPESVIPRYAAAFFMEICAPDSLITVSNGRSVASTVHEVGVQNWPKTNVTQMIGTLAANNPMVDSPNICRMLASRLGGTFTLLSCPMMLSSDEAAEAMRKEPQIATALALGGGADIAIVGIGSMADERSGHIFDTYIGKRDRERIRRMGAVGHICGHHIDAYGNHIRTQICARTISVDIERLHRIPTVIGVACGERKVEAIRACLKGKLITSLVTDCRTAQQLLLKE